MGLLSALPWGLLALAQIAAAMPIPPQIRGILIQKGRHDLVQRFEAIPLITPQEFAKKFLEAGNQQILGAGFNGIAFKDGQQRATKISFGIYAALGLVQLNPFVSRIKEGDLPALRENWQLLLQSTDIQANPVSQVRKVDEPVGSQPMGEELLGTLLWAMYNPGATSFPDMISSDGLAFRTRLVPGTPLKEILKSQREGSELHKNFDMCKIWPQVVYWQKIAETMLRDIGVTVDMFTPGNLLVSGSTDNPVIELIDNALARPSAQALEYYRNQGINIPEPTFAKELKLIIWPTISQHIVSNKLWDLSFDQAIEYVRHFYNLKHNHEAVDRMASFDEWVIIEAPFLGDFHNIRRARLLSAVRNGPEHSAARQATLLSRCAKLLEEL